MRTGKWVRSVLYLWCPRLVCSFRMFQFAGLPFRLRQSSFHVHMLSTSDRLSGIMTADAIVRHIK